MTYRICPCCGHNEIKIIEDGSYARCKGCEVEAHVAFWQTPYDVEARALINRAIVILEQSSAESEKDSNNSLESWLYDAELFLMLLAE